MARLRLRADFALVLTCLGLYVAAAAQARTPHGRSLSVALVALSDPVLYVANTVGRSFATVWEGERSLQATVTELGELRQETAELRRSNQLLTAEVSSLRQGNRLLNGFPSLAEGAVLARVVARDTLLTHTLRLDRGSADGIEVDAAVLADDGLVGRVDRIAPNACRVQLLSHPQAAAAAHIPNLPQESLLIGGDRPKLTGLPPYTEVPPDSPVISSGSEGIYPAGLLLATTLEARTEGLFTVVPVKLAVVPAEVAVVLVLKRGTRGLT